MDGVEGIRSIGNNAREAKSMSASIAVLKVLCSQFIKGIISWKKYRAQSIRT